MRRKEQFSNGNRRNYKNIETHSSSLKQAGMRALNSASYMKDPRESYASSQDDSPVVISKAWCVFDGRSCTYQAGHHPTDIREMASLTKMATFLTALRLMERFKLDADSLFFSVSENAATINGTSALLRENEWVCVQDLYYGLMLPSGNDAAIVLAENLGCLLYFESIGQTDIFNEIHSVDVTEDIYVNDYMRLFIKEMNNLSESLNLKSTRFDNPHGLKNRLNVSSCNDLAKLTFHCLKNEEFKKVVNTKIHKGIAKYVQYDNHVIERLVFWENTNKLLNKQGFRGVKTGITTSAGACLSSWYVNAVDDNPSHECNIIIIVLGSDTQEQRFQDTLRIAKWFHQKVKDRNGNSSGSNNSSSNSTDITY